MSSFQITASRPIINVPNLPVTRLPLSSRPFPSLTFSKCPPRTSLRLATHALKYQQCSPVCLFGGKGKPKNDSDATPWKSLENAMGSFKKDTSIEDVLRKQIEKNEYYDDGGSGGGTPPIGGGGSGGSEDGGFDGIMDEFFQVILATFGFIFLYMYIITGEELARLAKDYIKYLFGGNKSQRLRRAMSKWGKIKKKMTEKPRVAPENWLEMAIINTDTCYDSPEKYRQVLRNYVESTFPDQSTDADQSTYDDQSTYADQSTYDDDDQ